MDSTSKVAGILTLFSMAMLVGIGLPLGAIGLRILTLPPRLVVVDSYTVALMFIAFAFFASLIVYTKVRLSVGVLEFKRSE